MGRQIDVGAPEFACVRAVLKLSQGEFAERLGVSRRTVIRGEQRGIELPPSWTQREPGGLRDKWETARKEAEADPARYVEAAKSDTIAKILDKLSQDEKKNGTSYYGYSRRAFHTEFREKVARMSDTKTRAAAKVSPRPRPVKKRKLARRMKK